MHLPTHALRALVVLLSASFGSSLVFAQQGIKVDPLTLYPSASLSYGYNDNVLLTTNRVSSNTTVLAAGLRAELESGKSKYSVGYDGTFGRFEGSSTVYNYDYHVFSALADMDLRDRKSVV